MIKNGISNNKLSMTKCTRRISLFTSFILYRIDTKANKYIAIKINLIVLLVKKLLDILYAIKIPSNKISLLFFLTDITVN